MASQKWGDLCGDLYRFCARFVRLARIEENRKSSIYPLIFRLFSNRGHVAEWLRSGLQNRIPRFNSGRGLQQSNQALKSDFDRAKIGLGFSSGGTLGALEH